MLSFLKRIFGAKPAESTAAPYKVEASQHFPFPKEEKTAKAKKTSAKKPASKKPKKEKAQKA